MASCPTTLVLFTEDKVNFPIKYALVVVKQLFLYGVKEISVKENKIFINVSYSPRAITLKRKFGNLPVRYMRAKIENNDEFKILEKVVKRYKFNLLEEEEEEAKPSITGFGIKRKLAIEETFSSSSGSESNDEEEDKEQQVHKQQKYFINSKAEPSTSATKSFQQQQQQQQQPTTIQQEKPSTETHLQQEQQQ